MTRPLLQEPAPPRARDVAAGEALDASDAELVTRSLADPVAFDRHWAAIHAFCTSRAADAGEDLAAEAFRIAFDRRAAYDARYPSARPWLYGVATNVLREHFRGAERADRAARRTYALADRTVAEPLGALEAAQLGPRLAVAFASLDAGDRDALLLKLGAKQTLSEPTQKSLDDNFIRTSSLDVLVAGSARPQVRAGVLDLLATISAVSVTHGQSGGRPTLTLRNTDFPDHYVETLVVDARTGEPIRFVGGADGQTPGVTVSYDAARTTLARQGAR